jgi:antitoxin MazE
MHGSVKTKLVRIGNSQGIRIPKILLDQLNITGEVELEIQGDALLLRPARHPRAGWEEQFRQIAAAGDAGLLDAETGPVSSWDEEEWEWQ